MHSLKKFLLIAAIAAWLGAAVLRFFDSGAVQEEPEAGNDENSTTQVSRGDAPVPDANHKEPPPSQTAPEPSQTEPAPNSKGAETAEETSIGESERPDYDNEVALSNQITENITRHRSYLKDLYDEFEQIQNNPQTIIKLRAEDMRREDDRNTRADGLSTSAGARTMRDHYDALFGLNHALGAYIELEDYKTDGASRGMKILDDMSGFVADLADERNRLREMIYANRKNVVQNGHGKVYQMMIDIIDHEEKVLDYLDTLYQNEPAKGLDETFIIQSYLETEDLLTAFARDFNIRKPDPSVRFLKTFPESINKLQRIKQRTVDESSFIHKKSTNHVNEFVEEFTEYFNKDVLAVFKYYVKAAGKKDPAIFHYPNYLHLLRYKDYNLDIRIEPLVLSDTAVQSIDVKPRPDTLNRPAFEVLNGYVEALNVRTKSLDNFRHSLKNFQRDLHSLKNANERWQQQYNLRFYGDPFSVPKTDFAVLQKRSPLLIPDYSAQLLGQLENIQNTMLECERLHWELSAYSEKKLYLTAGFGKTEEMLERFSMLFDTFRSMKKRLYIDLLAIYDAYPDSEPDNPWRVTSGAMRRAVDAAESTLHAVKDRFSDDTSQVIATDALLSLRRDMVENQAKYMAGIRRIGRNNGHCPYNPYEDMTEKLKSMIDKIAHIDTYVESGRYDEYNGYVDVYNRIIQDYNKFAELAKGDTDSAKDDAHRPVYILLQATAF